MPVTETYSDYTKFDKILLPKSIKNESPYFNMSLENSYKLNEDIDDSEFTPDK